MKASLPRGLSKFLPDPNTRENPHLNSLHQGIAQSLWGTGQLFC